MQLVRFGRTVINMELVTNIVFFDDGVHINFAAAGADGQSFVTLTGGDVVALETWLDCRYDDAREPLITIPPYDEA